MPLFMDRHDLSNATALDVATAHLQDLETQERYGVRYVTYWFDYDRQSAFCLASGPSREAVVSVHRDAHGLLPNQIIEVDRGTVDRLLGPLGDHPPGEAYIDTAFRAILFTDIAGSTAITQRLGDTGAMRALGIHDRVVREALPLHSGSEVKHTGDGVMASFRSVVDAIGCAITIQRNVTAEVASLVDAAEGVAVRIGIAAGEPVTARDDLFGAAVQLASRLCDRAQPGGILVSGAVRDLAIGKEFRFDKGKSVRLKGFDEPVRSFEVAWLPD